HDGGVRADRLPFVDLVREGDRHDHARRGEREPQRVAYARPCSHALHHPLGASRSNAPRDAMRSPARNPLVTMVVAPSAAPVEISRETNVSAPSLPRARTNTIARPVCGSSTIASVGISTPRCDASWIVASTASPDAAPGGAPLSTTVLVCVAGATLGTT